MKSRAIVMIGIAAVAGAVSIFAANIWINSAADARVEQMKPVSVPARPAVEFGTIVVAKTPLRYGTELDASQLTAIPWPKDKLPEGAFATTEAVFAQGSRAVLRPIAVNEPVLLSKLSGPNGSAALSNLLAPGMRAVTIRTDEIAGVGGFITPGDHVDVVLTRDAGKIEEVQSNAAGAAGSTIATEIVVSDVKVLTVGQGADARKPAPRVAGSVTLEVTPQGAQKIALARNIGTLSLSLRSAADGSAAPGGLTTISAFGGSTADAANKVDALFTSAATPEEPKVTTVIVTRGNGDSQKYEVVAPVD